MTLTMTDIAAPLTTTDILQVAFPALNATSVPAASGAHPVHVIQQGTEPRWIIIGDPHKAVAILRSWRPWDPGSRLRWRAVVVAAAIKLLPRLPGVQNSIAHLDSSYWRRSLPGFPENWNAVIHVGHRSRTRKAIAFFYAEGQPVKFVAKVPLAQGAAGAISNEAAILLRMKEFNYLPRVLFQDSARGIAVHTWLDGEPVSRGFRKAHVDLLTTLANQGSSIRVSDFQAEVAEQLDRLDLPFDRSLLTHCLELLNYDEPLQQFVEHRDFAPWNLKWLADGKLGLIDWEWSVSNSLPWQDACRFFYLDDVFFNGRGKVWETITSNPLLLNYRRKFAIPSAALPALTMHYLLRVLCMDWQSGNERLALYTFGQIKSLFSSLPAPR